MTIASNTLTDQQLSDLVIRFYNLVRRDPELGPIFDDAVEDWDEHLEKLAAFWSSVMLSSGRYKGNPVAIHLAHADRITPELFERWLALWHEVTDEIVGPDAAAALQAKAERIAESLKYALFYRPGTHHSSFPSHAA